MAAYDANTLLDLWSPTAASRACASFDTPPNAQVMAGAATRVARLMRIAGIDGIDGVVRTGQSLTRSAQMQVSATLRRACYERDEHSEPTVIASRVGN